MQLKGAEILLQCLREEGVDTVFGYPGGQYFLYMMLCMNQIYGIS